ncbi:transposase family protein [Streptomyces sp. NPDC047461]|uniref:transposase family protein n=1 Tax=Streptomyces sp. NPDC047461 TaxID=3155619 RepID=UPI0033C552FD
MACPDCGRESARVHSSYRRTLADVVVGGRPLLIGLSVRRLFCDGADCARRTFAEQVEGLTVRYQRRSPLLQHLVEMAGVLLAGRGGARLLHIVKVQLSRTSVLFHLMRMRLPPVVTPRVLGVDDFALYADVYGTLLVNADTRLPIDLWAGRDAEQLAAWLRIHPGVEVACRDGSLTFRQGITAGAQTRCRSATVFTSGKGSRNGSRISRPPTAAACPAARQAVARDSPRIHRHGPKHQRDRSRPGPEPTDRGQVRTRGHLAGMRTPHPAPAADEP